jgi:DNA-directed RNA polymerase specialized sigma24 family protein
MTQSGRPYYHPVRFLMSHPPTHLDDTALASLVATTVAEVVIPMVQRTFRRSPALLAATEDVVADVRAKLIERLQAWRDGTADPVDNVAGYASTAAVHACYGLLRQRFPNRTRLRNRMRYVMTHHPTLALVEDPPGVWRCRVNKARSSPAVGATQQLLDSPRAFASERNLTDTTPLPSLLEGLLAACDGPVEFDRLVDVVVVILGVTDATEASPTEAADKAPMAEAVLEQRASLREVWAEILELPERQRAALLLNMRDPDGGGILDLLPATGVVTLDDIARALGMSLEDLRELWPDLPLDDLTIAARLGITRQQVINLRKSGRARLARRLAGNIGPDTTSSRSMGSRP